MSLLPLDRFCDVNHILMFHPLKIVKKLLSEPELHVFTVVHINQQHREYSSPETKFHLSKLRRKAGLTPETKSPNIILYTHWERVDVSIYVVGKRQGCYGKARQLHIKRDK